MTTTKDQIINEIAELRAINNDPWMKLVKLAFKHAPSEAAEAMEEVANNDAKITRLARMLITCA